MPITHIYILSDPETGVVRYIGKTRDPKARMRNHIGRKENNHKGNWIESLRRKNLLPEVTFIDEVPTEEWSFWEQHWIQVFRGWGFPLTNANAGGGEHAYFTPELKVKHKASFTEDVRQDMREKAITNLANPETKAKHVAATRAAMQRPEVKAKMVADEKTRLSRSATARARWADPEKAAEMRRRMLVANANPEVKAKRSENAKRQFADGGFSAVLAAAHQATSRSVILTKDGNTMMFPSQTDAGNFLGVHRSVVSDALSGLRKRKGNVINGWSVTEQ